MVCDVGPVLLGSEFLQVIYQAVTHGDDAVSHALYFLAPLKEEEDVSYAKKEMKKTREIERGGERG